LQIDLCERRLSVLYGTPPPRAALEAEEKSEVVDVPA
jgi:hypothetical protein